MQPYKFAPASPTETIVFGAARPGYTHEQVQDWITFMQQQGIQRVCCLLDDDQLSRYANLLSCYQQAFGDDYLLWAPIPDFQLATQDTLTQRILPFLAIAHQQNEKVVVHCAGGIGRTGQVLAAWLVRQGAKPRDAIATVKKMGRNPQEAAIAALLQGRNPWMVLKELEALLEVCSL